MRLYLIQKPEPTAAIGQVILGRNNTKPSIKAYQQNNMSQDSAYSLANVFKEVIVNLRKRFHLLAQLHGALE